GAMYYPLLSPLHSVATHRHLHSFPTRRSSDLEYLSTLIDILPKLLNDEKPDFIFYLSGVDVLGTDKLGRLNLSIDGCKERDRIVLEMCRNSGIPVQVSLGGGYSPNIKTIVDAHANTFRLAQEIFF